MQLASPWFMLFLLCWYSLPFALAEDLPPIKGAQPMTTSCPLMLQSTQGRLHSAESLDLCQFAGQPLLIVNTASHCGFTKQFQGLEALHQKYSSQGLVILGFPSNDFFQEAQSEEKIAEVCLLNFGVSFPMLKPTHVRRNTLNPVFQALFDQGAPRPRWNFNKYLVDTQGHFVQHFGATTPPDKASFVRAIEALLNPSAAN